MRLVLASSSPRRAELLRAAGIPFTVRVGEVDESYRDGESPEAYVTRLARAKAEAAGAVAGAVVLGADTTVVVDGACLGKPGDDAEARDMLRRLSGRTHDVLTGIAILHPAGALVDRAATRVTFQRLAEDELAWYVGTGEPRDKAGAYGIQGAASRFVTGIAGSYSNVVGLPVELVYQHLRALGFTGWSEQAAAR